MSNATFDKAVLRCIPSEFNMISAADDSQQAEEAYNAVEFELPNPNGKEGGACTSALLQVFYDNAHRIGKLTWIQVLKHMRGELKSMGFNQEPFLSSSRPIDAGKPLYIVPPGSGKRRALLIGINYVGQQGALKAPHNDTNNVKDYLINVLGFQEQEILVLMDDGNHPMPTKQNIMDGCERLVRYSQPGDVVFISFSGHGGNVKDEDGDEEDGMDETIIPVDFREAGHIVDDDILADLIKPMPEGVHCTMLMDCCHSGSVADLPYKMGADDPTMHIEKGFNSDTAEEIAAKRKAKANQRVDENGKPIRGGDTNHREPVAEHHVEPLPYNPEKGFVVRMAKPKKKAEPPPPPSWQFWHGRGKKDKEKKDEITHGKKKDAKAGEQKKEQKEETKKKVGAQ